MIRNHVVLFDRPHVVTLFLCSKRPFLDVDYVCPNTTPTRGRPPHPVHACPPFQPDSGQFAEFVPSSQPTMLENFSRAVRNYVPTSIPVPTAAPSPPRVSMPVSFGNFMGANMGHSPPHSWERESLTGSPSSERRRVRQSSSHPFPRARGSLVGSPEVQTATLGSEDGDFIRGNHLLTAYPTVAEGDNVLWSRWDSLPQLNSKPR